MIIEGYAIRYNESSYLIPSGRINFFEVIVPGALDKTDLSDIDLLYSHHNNIMTLASTRSGKLKLFKEPQGLYFIAELADTTGGKDAYELIKRGDLSKMSFAFVCGDEYFDKANQTRMVKRIAKMSEISIVTKPAYPTTSVKVSQFDTFDAAVRKRLLLSTTDVLSYF